MQYLLALERSSTSWGKMSCTGDGLQELKSGEQSGEKRFSISFEGPWCFGEVPEDYWRKANVTAIFKKGKKENPGNFPQALRC